MAVSSFHPGRQAKAPRQVGMLHGVNVSLFLGHLTCSVSPSRYWMQLKGNGEGGLEPLCPV